MKEDRRVLLKHLVLSSGAATAYNLPAAWTTPVVESVLAPAHAQTTGPATGPTSPSGFPLTFVSVILETTTLQIEGVESLLSFTINNSSGTTVEDVIVNNWIEQGSAERAAGGLLLFCGTNLGDVDPGNCTQNSGIFATNGSIGSGTLVPGAATARFDLELNGDVKRQYFVPITLIA